VVSSPRRPSLAGLGAGLAGLGPARALEVARGLWAIVADAPEAAWRASEVERRLQDLDWVTVQAAAHEAVLEAFLGKGGLVPLRLFTLFSGDARAQEDLAARATTIREVLEATRGRREWTFKVTLDAARARTQAAARARAEATPPAGPAGQAFLLRKKRERDAASEAVAQARVELAAALAELRGRATSLTAREPGPQEGALLTDVTFLVARGQERRFLAAADAACARLAALGCEARVSGPWPPYVAAAALGASGRA
jgi:hypothetical protein